MKKTNIFDRGSWCFKTQVLCLLLLTYMDHIPISDFGEGDGLWKNASMRQFGSAIRINFGYGERAEPAGLEFSKKDLNVGIEEQDLITDIEDLVLDL
nr:hypothetical protein [Tanacetum cinerariifolium]